MYTVKKLSQIAGITIRTLHYYDEIGLLKPSLVGDNGYRYYGEESLLRLQQILLYRELGIPLGNIKKLMGRRDFDILGALESHKTELHKRVVHLKKLITTVEHTILHLKGEKEMSNKQLFEVFSDAQQAEYEKEAMQMYDPEIVKASHIKWKKYTTADKKRIGDEGNAIYQDLLKAMPLDAGASSSLCERPAQDAGASSERSERPVHGAESSAAQDCIKRWRKHMDYFWTPNDEQVLGLADLYNTDPRFKANFAKIDPHLAEFMRAAVQVYIKNLKK